MRQLHTCLKCNYQWFSISCDPKRCPECNSYRWNFQEKYPEPTRKDEVFLPMRHNGDYLISNYGAIYSLKNNKFLIPHGRIVNIDKKTYTIAKILLQTFIPTETKRSVGYKDGDTFNIQLKNLYWK